MLREQLSLDAARMVTPRALLSYVQGLGWQAVANGKSSDIAIFHRPDSQLHQVLVPIDTGLDDYAEAVAEVVRKLAQFEHLPAPVVLEQLLLPPADLLRLREVSPEAETGNLPLAHAVRVLSGTRKVLLAVAHSVLAPQPYHPRLSRSEAEGFVARCRLGQTQRGSFILTVACPFDMQVGLFGPNNEPFARRVTSLLMKSLHDLSQGTDPRRLAELLDPGRHPGISANFCEALLGLKPAGDRAHLDVALTWSREFPSPEHAPKQEIQLHQEVFEIAEALAPRLRSLPQPRRDRFYGFVEELRGNPGPAEPRPSGEVRFTLFDQEEEIHARADLTVDDYAEAITAHASTALVSFKGVLQRLPRLNRIDKITDFRRVRLDDDGVPVEGASTNV